MEVSALRQPGTIGLHARSPFLRLQSDERLVALTRGGNQAAFETLVARYEGRLLPFCRHMLRSREDAEDVLQEAFAAAFNALMGDERAINVRPWLYRIARNRCLNHLRRAQTVGVDSMDVHFSEHGASTADKFHAREEFRALMEDIRGLPESQRSALLLREMEALSYGQIAEAMETTVPSVKSLLVRARVGLAEAAEARRLTCEEVRIQLGEIAEGLQRRPDALVRRHLKACGRCTAFQTQLKETNRALAALLPLTPLVLLKKLVLVHLGHSAGSGATAAGTGATAAGTALAGSGATGFMSTAVGAVASKAAAGFAAAALVTAGAVEVRTIDHHRPAPSAHREFVAVTSLPATSLSPVLATVTEAQAEVPSVSPASVAAADRLHLAAAARARALAAAAASAAAARTVVPRARLVSVRSPGTKPELSAAPAAKPGRTTTQTDATVISLSTATGPLIPAPAAGSTGATGASPANGPTGSTGGAGPSNASGSSPATGSSASPGATSPSGPSTGSSPGQTPGTPPESTTGPGGADPSSTAGSSSSTPGSSSSSAPASSVDPAGSAGQAIPTVPPVATASGSPDPQAATAPGLAPAITR